MVPLLLLGAAMMLVGGARASAATIITFDNHSAILSGAYPEPQGTYAQAIFEQVGQKQVKLTINVTNQVTGMFIGAIGFQFASKIDITSGNAPSYQGGANGSQFNSLAQPDNLVGSGNEKFNALFDYPQGKNDIRLQYNHSSVYLLTFVNNIGDNLSNLFEAPNPTKPKPIAGVHLQGYGGDLNPDTSVGLAGHLASVPEPGTIVMSSMAFVGVGLMVARKRKAATQK